MGLAEHARSEEPEPEPEEVDSALATRLDEVFDDPLRTTDVELLTIRGLTVRFGGLTALQKVDLDVGHHDLVSIIGPNGAGKTTTLNAICQLIRSTGSITFAGRRIDKELDALGIIARARGHKGLAEEQPAAYKDVDQVVEVVDRAGLAAKVARLRPVGVIKG